MHFVKKLIKLQVRHHLLLGSGAHETPPPGESVASSGLVRGLLVDLSVSEPFAPEAA